MKRYDYRREFKEMNKEQLQKQLEHNKNRMLDCLCWGMNTDSFFKRVCYIESLLKKIN
jgi:hypothetical protein